METYLIKAGNMEYKFAVFKRRFGVPWDNSSQGQFFSGQFIPIKRRSVSFWWGKIVLSWGKNCPLWQFFTGTNLLGSIIPNQRKELSVTRRYKGFGIRTTLPPSRRNSSFRGKLFPGTILLATMFSHQKVINLNWMFLKYKYCLEIIVPGR